MILGRFVNYHLILVALVKTELELASNKMNNSQTLVTNPTYPQPVLSKEVHLHHISWVIVANKLHTTLYTSVLKISSRIGYTLVMLFNLKPASYSTTSYGINSKQINNVEIHLSGVFLTRLKSFRTI